MATLKVQYTSENLELVRRELKHNHYRDLYPNAALTAECDVTEEIYLTNSANKIEASYSWVKCHQDLHIETSKLSLEAQLNIEADKLARDFQQQYRTYNPRATVTSITSHAVYTRYPNHKPILSTPITHSIPRAKVYIKTTRGI